MVVRAVHRFDHLLRYIEDVKEWGSNLRKHIAGHPWNVLASSNAYDYMYMKHHLGVEALSWPNLSAHITQRYNGIHPEVTTSRSRSSNVTANKARNHIIPKLKNQGKGFIIKLRQRLDQYFYNAIHLLRIERMSLEPLIEMLDGYDAFEANSGIKLCSMEKLDAASSKSEKDKEKSLGQFARDELKAHPRSDLYLQGKNAAARSATRSMDEYLSNLTRCKGYINIPYSTHSATDTDIYATGVPMLVPSVRLMTSVSVCVDSV